MSVKSNSVVEVPSLESPPKRRRRHGVVETPSPEDLESGQKRKRRHGVVEAPTLEELESPKRRRRQASSAGLLVSAWSAEEVTDYLRDRGIPETLLQVLEGEQVLCSFACLQGKTLQKCGPAYVARVSAIPPSCFDNCTCTQYYVYIVSYIHR